MHPGAVSIGTKRLGHILLWTTREAAKADELLVYNVDITLASVATIVSEPIYTLCSWNAEVTCYI